MKALLIAVLCAFSVQASASYQSQCADTFISAGYSIPSQGFGDMCSQIHSAESLACLQGLVSHKYDNLNANILSGCSYATWYGVDALNALFNNGYNNVTSDLLAAVGRVQSRRASECMIKIFNQRYNNLTPNQLRGTCY